MPDLILLFFISLWLVQILFDPPIELRVHFFSNIVMTVLDNPDKVRELKQVKLFKGIFGVSKQSQCKLKWVDFHRNIKVLQSLFSNLIKLLQRINLSLFFRYYSHTVLILCCNFNLSSHSDQILWAVGERNLVEIAIAWDLFDGMFM